MAGKNDMPPELQAPNSPDELEGDLSPDTQSSSVSSSLVVTPLSGNSGSITDVSELSTIPSSSSFMSATSSLEEVAPISRNSESVTDFSTISPLPSSSCTVSSTSSSVEVTSLSSNLESSSDVSKLSTVPSSSSVLSTASSSDEVPPLANNLEGQAEIPEVVAVESSHSLASTQPSLREGTPLSVHSESTSDISELSSLSEISNKTESLNIQEEKPSSSATSDTGEQSQSLDLSLSLDVISRFFESGEIKVDRHLFIFSEIRKLALMKVQEKDLRVILKKILSNVPSTDKSQSPEVVQPLSQENQSSEGASSGSSSMSLNAAENSPELVEEKIIRAVCGTPESSSPDEQFLQDRLNTLADMLEQIKGLTRLLKEANICGGPDADRSPGPSSRSPSVEAVPTIVQLFGEAQRSLENVSEWTNRLFNWFMTSNFNLEQLREWLNEINMLSESSGFQTVRDRLAAWESNRSSIDHLGNATCLLVIEKEISELLQTLISEIHIIQYKYWMDKGKEMSTERGENGTS